MTNPLDKIFTIVQGRYKVMVVRALDEETYAPKDLTSALQIVFEAPRAGGTGKAIRRLVQPTFATTAVDIATDVITIEDHGYVEEEKIQFTTTGTLPAGLSLVTDYYVKYLSENTFSVSATAGGDAIDITDVGSGTHQVSVTHITTPVPTTGQINIPWKK